MAIPSKEIGYGTEEKLLWQISKQIQNLIGVTYNSGSGFSTTYVPYTGATSNVNLGSYNISANSFINGFSSITASGTQVVLTVNSAPEILVSGSGGQTIKLPDATTLANGTTFSFNNNQSSGAISVNNNSNTLVLSIPSGGYAEIMLLSNSTAAGSWDKHFQAPSNVSWSTNTLDYPGSITSATWNGNVIQPNRGGTGQSTYTDGQLLIGNTTGNTLSKSTLTPGTGISIVNGNGTITITATGAVSGAVTGSGTTNYVPKFTSASVIGNSNIQDSGTLITLGSNTTISSGSLGIGITPQTNYGIRVARTITSNVDSTGISSEGQIQSDVTNTAHLFSSVSNTQASAFTLSLLRHFVATQGTIGASSAITTQVGFLAQSNLTGATTNIGFQGSIPSGTNRWNLYMNGTADNYLAGSLGIGTTGLAASNLVIGKNITGNVSSYAILSFGLVQSDVTTNAYGFLNQCNTQAASFTLGSYLHYSTSQGTLGAGSSINIQIGFQAGSSLTGATTNIGFRGQIPSGTNRWNIFMDGTASNYLAGNTLIGTTTDTGEKLQITGTTKFDGNTVISSGGLAIGASATIGGISGNLNLNKNITGGTLSYAVSQTGIVQSDVTSLGISYLSSLNTQATAFTLGEYRHFSAAGAVLGSGSALTIQTGYHVGSNHIQGTTNYGFRSLIPSGTNRWNLYMDGTADNYLAGSLGIGTTTLTGYSFNVGKSITGSTTAYGINQFGTIQSDVTSSAYGFLNTSFTAASAFTLGIYFHYFAQQGIIGSGSSITNQYGYYASSNLIGATNNYGFLGDIPSGTNRWNLYMNGTANNYMAGALGIGTTSLTGFSLKVSKTITGATDSFGISQSGTVQSDVTGTAYGYSNQLYTSAASFTLVNYRHYSAIQTSIGAGSSITNQTGYYVDSSMIGATNNYGFYGDISSGSNRWNLYMVGTANNYLAGSLGIGVTTANASALLQVDSTTQGVLFPRMTTTQKNAISSPATGLVVFDTTLGKLCVFSTTWQTISSS